MMILFISTLTLLNCQQAEQKIVEPAPKDSMSYFWTGLPKYSKNITIAGERLPLEDEEIKDRFDREFYNILHNENVNVQTISTANWMLPIIKKIFQEEQVPEDLIYLGYAETGLKFATSAAGAAGVWQLMELVARDQDLKINYWVDERHNLEKSTRVACRYLKTLFKKYNDWNIAIAAYNVGETNINDNLKFQNVKNFFDLYLNEETSRYVFRVYAMKEIFENPAKYGMQPYQFITKDQELILIEGPVQNLALLAQKNGITYRELRNLNPWIKRRGLPDGKWNLIFPKNRNINRFDTSIYKYENLKTLDNLSSREASHTVIEGENILSIALKYDVEVSEIMRWNKLASQLVQPGQRLKIMLW